MFHKRPARYDVGADINDATISAARERFADRRCQLINAGALTLLEALATQLTTSAAGIGFDSGRQQPDLSPMAMVDSFDFRAQQSKAATITGDRSQNHLRDRAVIYGEGGILPSHLTARDVVVYADPPYFSATRKSSNRLYQFEPGVDAINEVAWHTRLLDVLDSLPCYVLLSGYRSELYEKLLAQPKWRTIDYNSMTHSGVAIETLWCNFPEPAELHDYSYLGKDKRERQRIKRKVLRWQLKLSKMTTLERQAIRAALNSI